MKCCYCNEEFRPAWVAVQRSARLKQQIILDPGTSAWQITGIIRAICPCCGEDNDRSISEYVDPSYLLRLIARREGNK